MKRFRQIFITVVIFLLLFSAMAYGVTWSTNKRLTNNSGDSYYPAIAVDGSNIYVVWEDDTPGNNEIYFKKSDDGGTTWTTKKNLSNNSGDSYLPSIVVDGSNIYVVWEDDTPENSEIYFKRSDDGGVTWTANKRLTNNLGNSYSPAIAVDSSNIYVAWEDNTPVDYEIYFKRSDDGGITWTADERLTNNSGDSYHPAIAVNVSNIYIVWYDNTPGNWEIYFKRSDDGGVTWTSNKRLTNNAGVSYSQAIAVDGSDIYVAWMDDTSGDYEIYFKRSDDGGVIWTSNKRLTDNSGDSYSPSIAVDGSNIYVVWDDYTPGNYEIYFKRGNLY